jgi:transposase InsO family protein
LLKAVRYYRAVSRFTRVLTDNGASYRSRSFARLLRRLGLCHKRTRPYTPRTKDNAERFIHAALREWAYACSYDHFDQCAAHLTPWLHEYNWHRLHTFASLFVRAALTGA